MEWQLNVRAHHLLCIPRFYSGGYDKKFATNMKKVCLAIRKNPRAKVKILVGKLDCLCKKCPYGHNGKCTQPRGMGKWVVLQDKKVAKYFKLKPNSIHAARDVFNLSMDQANDKTIKSVCKGCVFLNDCTYVGINNSFRNDLNRNSNLAVYT